MAAGVARGPLWSRAPDAGFVAPGKSSAGRARAPSGRRSGAVGRPRAPRPSLSPPSSSWRPPPASSGPGLSFPDCSMLGRPADSSLAPEEGGAISTDPREAGSGPDGGWGAFVSRPPLQLGLTLSTREAPQALSPGRTGDPRGAGCARRKRKQVEAEGRERADLRRPGIPEPLRVTLQMGKPRQGRRSGRPAAPPRPGRPPTPEYSVMLWGEGVPPLTVFL